MTGSRNGSGTTAHVGCKILGDSESSGPCYLIDTSRALFRRGDLNVFIISLPNSLGLIRGLRVWHDNSGKSPGWFLNRAMLRDCQTGDKWIFLSGMKNQCRKWLVCLMTVTSMRPLLDKSSRLQIGNLNMSTQRQAMIFNLILNTLIVFPRTERIVTYSCNTNRITRLHYA